MISTHLAFDQIQDLLTINSSKLIIEGNYPNLRVIIYKKLRANMLYITLKD
jgi:hypothetical protein